MHFDDVDDLNCINENADLEADSSDVDILDKLDEQNLLDSLDIEDILVDILKLRGIKDKNLDMEDFAGLEREVGLMAEASQIQTLFDFASYQCPDEELTEALQLAGSYF